MSDQDAVAPNDGPPDLISTERDLGEVESSELVLRLRNRALQVITGRTRDQTRAVVLEGEPSIEVVGETSDGIDATRQILSERRKIGIVGLSLHGSDEVASSMREAGAADFVTKGGRSDRLVSAILAAGRRGTGSPSR